MISLRRVAVHNLKEIDLDLPIGKLIVFCGRSGSGKSSLALDTLYAEGQRRYIETFSPAMRQFLEKVEKPKAARLAGIPPAIAVTSSVRKTDTMTVGDAAGLSDYFAMLFAHVGHVFCPKCSRPIMTDSPQTIWQTLNTTVERGAKMQIAFAPPLEGTPAEFAAVWKEQGFLRGCNYSPQTADSRRQPKRVSDVSPPVMPQDSTTPLTSAAVRRLPPVVSLAVFRLDEPIPEELYKEGLFLIVDRMTFDPAEEERTIESLETAFEYGGGKCFILLENQTFPFSRMLSCEYCNVLVPPLTPQLFRTDWINHIHLHADVNSPTINDLCRSTVADLLKFFSDYAELGFRQK